MDGRKHVLGVWLGDGGEGAKFWLSVLTEIRHRGLEDVLIVCCDGLKGLPDAIEATWPQALIQTCVIHLIRASTRLCSWKDRKTIARGLRAVYTAVNAEAAVLVVGENPHAGFSSTTRHPHQITPSIGPIPTVGARR